MSNEKPSGKSKCAVFDFTMPAPENWEETKNTITGLYPSVVKSYTFQLEKGDSGYMHFQGRISLVKKRYLEEVIGMIHDMDGLEKMFVRNTCLNSVKNDKEAFYCLKLDTRVKGPWRDDVEEVYIPRQVREIEKLFPWQQYVVDHCNDWDTRIINVVVDYSGNTGKSTLVQYMRAYGLARKIPFSNDYKDICRMVCDMPVSKCYLFDMPRAINKDKLYQFYAAIEEIKGGYAFDDRYNFKERCFDCPNIWVFSNSKPDESLLSKGRWVIWNVSDSRRFL